MIPQIDPTQMDGLSHVDLHGGRVVSPEDLADLQASATALRAAQRRHAAVNARIVDAYDIEPWEVVQDNGAIVRTTT